MEPPTATLTATTAAAVAVAGLWWLKSKHAHMAKVAATSPFVGIPTPPGGHWLLGHMVAMNTPDMYHGSKRLLLHHADSATGLTAVWAVNQRAISVLRGADAKAVYMASITKPSHSYVGNHLRYLLGKKSMIVLEGKEWKLYRRAVHKSFTPTLLQESQEAINHVGKTLARSLLERLKMKSPQSQQQEHKVYQLMKMATADVFGLCFLGVDFGASRTLELPQLAASFEFLTSEFQRRVKRPFDLPASQYEWPTPTNRKHAHHRKIIRSYILEQLVATKNNQATGNSQAGGGNLLSHIWKAAEAEAKALGQIVDAEAVCDVAMTLLFAGYDTTSITLSFALYLLAKNPNIYQTCLEEVDAVFQAQGEGSGLQSYEKLPYTRAVIQESLRLYSPVVVGSRVLEKELVLHGHVIPQGTVAYVPVSMIHTHECNFPDPLAMRPDRWVREKTSTRSSTSASSSHWEERPSDDTTGTIAVGDHDSFLAFSAGARNCVGKTLAVREAVTLLAYLVHTVQFDLVDPSYTCKPVVKLLTEPSDGMPMLISARTRRSSS